MSDQQANQLFHPCPVCGCPPGSLHRPSGMAEGHVVAPGANRPDRTPQPNRPDVELNDGDQA